jgi:MATE family multidrug resistance protein
VKTVVPKLARLAWPVTLARLGIMGMGLCDVIVVGQLAPGELADQALGWAPTAVLLVSGIGMLTGVQVLGARAMGAGLPTQAGGAWRRGVVVALTVGGLAIASAWLFGELLFRAFGIAPLLARSAARVMRILVVSIPLHLVYLSSAFFFEAIQRPMRSTIVMWLANVVNLALNLWLVPKHGAVGSAWATVGARLFLAAALSAWVLLLDDAAQFGVRARAHAPSYREFLGVGAAAALSQAAEAGAFSGMTIIAGRLGAAAVAAYQILLNALAVVFMLALGIATATTVLTSEALGRQAPSDAARASWSGVVLNTAIMFFVAGLFWAFAPLIAGVYTTDGALRAAVIGLLPLTAAVLAPDGAQAVLAAGLRAHRDNWFPTASHVLAYACVMPVLGLTLAETQGMGVAGLVQAIVAASVLSAGVLLARLWVVTRHARCAPKRSTFA